jgi:predicted aldo/keto reductase-like oxidoreductase
MNGAIELVLARAPDYFDVALIAMRMVPAPGNPEPDVGGDAGKRFLKNLKALREKRIGILSMKSGAHGAVRKGPRFFQSHAKVVLQAGADSVLTSFNTFEQIDMIKTLDLKSPHLTPAERKAAVELRRNQTQACLMCGNCNKVCPRGLPVSDLMRCRMYHEEYGWHEHARAEYAALGVDWKWAARDCAGCSACAGVCPVGLTGPETIARVASRLA